MSRLLEGKVALVTGGSSGIGFGIASRFIAEGAKVVIAGRRQEELDIAVAKLGKHAAGLATNVSQQGQLQHLVAFVERRHGRLDVLVANAGGGEMAPLGSITEAQFDETFSTNVKGVLFTVQAALPLMHEGGSIILTASTTSIKGNPAFSVYSASKAAVRSFARSWILDLKQRGIRVNVLSPGPIKTPGLVGLVADEQQEAFLEQLRSTIPLGRVGEPDEIGKAAVFLASDMSSFVNGIELFVDGGQAQI
jgi:NAD(P)-dependent dehydrogenase (short-subunit alcohol dehydrogenase family)